MVEPRGPRVLQFEPFTSCMGAGFWSAVTKKKLEEYGLDESPRDLRGSYAIGNAPNLPCLMDIDNEGLSTRNSVPPRCFPCFGKLLVYNTIERFRDADKQAITDAEAAKVWQIIVAGEGLENPSILNRFLLLSFMDLKKYMYTYWFLFPALVFPDKWVHETEPRSITDVFSGEEMGCILQWVDFAPLEQNAFLIVRKDGLRVFPLCGLPQLLQDDVKIIFALCDASVRDDNPGWTARNLLALLAYHIRNHPSHQRLQVLCFRDRFRDGKRDVDHSVVFDLRMVFTPNQVSENITCPKGVGWEKNESGRLGPRHVDLSAQLDPRKLAEQAVDLNLKLMRWRLVPQLDLPAIAKTRCLILGSGTLGCSVARCLMGWGITALTFVDNSKVSYSNPVRQSLFTFADCLDGGSPKSRAAAESVTRIFPGMNASAYQLNIPMPGHSVHENIRAKVLEAIETLEDLIAKNDAIFLLMDTRESRWLPTVLGASQRKIIINAALGFDSYLVMRHGMLPASGENKPDSDSEQQQQRLGCYFCNDVVAPGNSTRDRTLDQQCTVTRPGVSMIAAALAVELLVTIIQHPQGVYAPADTTGGDSSRTLETPSALGVVPHQIRGFLSSLTTVLPATFAFDKCTACSDIVIEEYQRRGKDFLFEVFNEPASFLEDITGLTKLHEDSEKVEIWDLSDDESVGGTDNSKE